MKNQIEALAPNGHIISHSNDDLLLLDREGDQGGVVSLCDVLK